MTSRTEAGPERLLTLDEAATYLGITPKTLRKLQVPRVKLAPKVIRVRWDDLQSYIAERAS